MPGQWLISAANARSKQTVDFVTKKKTLFKSESLTSHSSVNGLKTDESKPTLAPSRRNIFALYGQFKKRLVKRNPLEYFIYLLVILMRTGVYRTIFSLSLYACTSRDAFTA